MEEVWHKIVLHITKLWIRFTACLGMHRIACNCTRLSKLKIGRSRQVGDGGIGKFGEGLTELRHQVNACEYEDVQKMWQMLQRSPLQPPLSPERGREPLSPERRRRQRPLWKRISGAGRDTDAELKTELAHQNNGGLRIGMPYS